MPTFSRISAERLSTAHPDLQRLFNEVIKHFDCVVLCGKRSKEEQDKAVAEKKSKTPWPQSKHNTTPAAAVDVAPYNDQNLPVDWNDIGRFYYFAGFVMGIASQMGINIRYGGDWDKDTQVKDETFKDLPHFELADITVVGTAVDGGPMIR
jgi:peptidoglycan L-alanyl-D-glutamate endopeptidase CwlK